ncbi:MAG: hypothetical protein APR54_06200 [Candidatus Cloacimonas sp. SDB]|nr:MAG: hypothetical protein APR54_06200 [Candidatus Cloacimonas sp. SDB]
MKILFFPILLCLIFSFNLFSQTDFSDYPVISPDNLEGYNYTIIYQNDEPNIKLVIIDGVTYVIYY